MENITLKRLSRFPRKRGRYIVTILGKGYSEEFVPVSFALEDGKFTYLKAPLVVYVHNEWRSIADFKKKFEHFASDYPYGIRPDVELAYYEVKSVFQKTARKRN